MKSIGRKDHMCERREMAGEPKSERLLENEEKKKGKFTCEREDSWHQRQNTKGCK